MEFYTLYQNPRVFKRDDAYLQFNVPNHLGSSRLKAFQKNQDDEHRSLVPIFKSPRDADRFRKEVIYLNTVFRWEVNDTFPIEENMNHLSITADILHLPEPQRGGARIARQPECVSLDLGDVDTVLSLCLRANYGFFVVGSFNVVSTLLTINGVVVDPLLDYHFNDTEHINVLKQSYENLYLKNNPI